MHSERIPYSTGWHVSIPNKQENPGSVKTRAVLLLPGQETTLLLGSHTHTLHGFNRRRHTCERTRRGFGLIAPRAARAANDSNPPASALGPET